MEQSLVLIKPDAMKRGLAGLIISRLEQRGLKLVALKMLHMDRELAERHYAAHKSKAFFDELIKYITSGPVIAAVFEGEKAIEAVRQTMGVTDPLQAAPGSIRGDFGLSIKENLVHGSDSRESAAKEIGLFFSSGELFKW